MRRPARTAFVLCLGLACAWGPAPDVNLFRPLDPLLRVVKLDSERVAPTSLAGLVKLPPVAGRRRYAIGNYPVRPSQSFVDLYMPEEFVGRDTWQPAAAWGLNFFAWYPEMTGFRTPGTHHTIHCAKDCEPGEMLVSVTNGTGNLRSGPEARLRVLQDRMADPAQRSVATFAAAPDFAPLSVVQERYSDPERDQDYYSDPTARIFIACSPHVPNPLCSAYTTATVNPAVDIDFSFRSPLLPQWRQLQTAVRRVVDDAIAPVSRTAPDAGAAGQRSD
jgi:hypothetical protein